MSWDSGDVIFAPATPKGEGALGIIRVSGPRCWEVFNSTGKYVPNIESHRAYYIKLRTSDGRFLDEVLVTFFKHGRSFTGEESFEISCHGSPFIIQSICDYLTLLDFRHADAGEFSYRAYKNGKIDLIKAEGIHHSIVAKSEISKDLALNLLSGGLSQQIEKLRSRLLMTVGHLEASIDFSEEDIETEKEESLINDIFGVRSDVESLLETFHKGQILSKGLRVSLLGFPNSGKSSLFNKLAGDERAIVSDIPGTTRDYISVTIQLDGHPIELIDTAGIRNSNDSIESEGIKRALDVADSSQLVLLLVDPDQTDEFLEIYGRLKNQNLNILAVLTKQDLGSWDLESIECDRIGYSIYDNSLGVALKERISKILQPYLEIGPFIFVDRHFKSLSDCVERLNEVHQFESISGSEELILNSIYGAMDCLGEMLFIENPEEVRDLIFKEFCLGK